MKTNRFLSVLLTIFTLNAPVCACINLMDEQSFGIMFNNNEVLSFNNFDSLGKEGTHFFRSCMMIKPAPGTKDVVLLTPTKDPNNWNDLFSIKNVSITCNLLEIEVEYGGGCNTHEFMLYVDSVLITGNPSKLNFTLLHDANGDKCKALITETLIYNIKPIEELYTGQSPLPVLINNNTMGIKWYRDNACTIKYRSHYDSALMVYLEYSRMAIAASQVFPSVRIILAPNVKYACCFDYGKILVTELQWLTKNKIASGIAEKTLTRIEQTMKDLQGQYWTHQDSLIPYNAFFSLTKDNPGEWVWGDLIQTKGPSCGTTLEYTLPPESLSSISTANRPVQVTPAWERFSVKFNADTYQIDLGRNHVSPATIELIDLKGRLLRSFTIPAHQKSFVMQSSVKPASGMYQVILRTKEILQKRALIITE